MTLDEYQQQARVTAPEGDSALIQGVLGLAGESGEIADRIKRWLRDDQGDPAQLDRKVLAHELGDALWHVATLAGSLGLRLEDVARSNLAWRADGRKRGAPGGSGTSH
jgi:NTP pyrophosphatase (non-canonical NTP hydrolase)